MGTNFYMYSSLCPKGKHIGKRSAAGPYCWDCNETLCKQGKERIHYSSNNEEWFDTCPSCGKKIVPESLNDSAGGKELGFNRQSGKKTGIKSCSSFTWAIDDPVDFILTLKDWKKSKNISIHDEYQEKISIKDFLKMIIEDCPIRYYMSVGKEFS